MFENEITINTGEGQMNTFIVHPDEDGPHPVILFLMDAPGKREELHQMARRIAACGYWVMLPNLYYRRVKEFVSDGTDESREIMFEHKNSLSNEMVVEDCKHLLAEALKHETASKGTVGCLGNCMSGPFAFAAAAEINDRIRATASPVLSATIHPDLKRTLVAMSERTGMTVSQVTDEVLYAGLIGMQEMDEL